MFLNKNYILANELVSKMDINIANVSILKREYEDNGDYTTITSLNDCSFINIKANKLPKNIKNGIEKYSFIDMSDKLPCSFFKEEVHLSDKRIMSSSIIKEKIEIFNKDFYVFTDEFIQTVKGKVLYVLSKDETYECMRKSQIQGFIQISKNKFLTWYSMHD